jgi:hypothetical protein
MGVFVISSVDYTLTEVQESVKISLDCTQASFIAGDKLVTSLRGGELYVKFFVS